MYDVAVIGGGPSGSQVAFRLAGMGYGVVVLERKERLDEPVCCTGIIGQECVSSFAIDESVILRRANGAEVFSPSGRRLSLWRPRPQACIVDRSALNLFLAGRAQSKGAEYVLDAAVRSVEVGEDGVTIEITARDGGKNFLEARAAVIAAGFASKLVEGLGLGKAGDFAMGAQAEVETIGVDGVEVYLGREIAPAFFAWLVPTSPQKALVGLLSRCEAGFYLGKLMSTLLARGKIVSSEVTLTYRGVPLKPLGKSYSSRILIVGAAAGQVKPTTGGGVYYGLLCADMAAENLHRALTGDNLSARNLANYEIEWKKKLGRELRVGYWARKLYERLSDAQVDRIFDIIKSNGIDQALLEADELSFDWHGDVVLRLLGHRFLSRAAGVMKLPFSPGRRV